MPSYTELRILKISRKHNLSHIGSCLMAQGPIEAIYKTKQPQDIFILSSGHAGLALYCILEQWGFGDAEKLYLKHGTHPNRDLKDGIWASTGSLGHGIGIGVGMAIAEPDKIVYIVSTDGEMAEGSVWEALRIAGELQLKNIRLAVVCNGYGGYGKIDVDMIEKRLDNFYPCIVVKANLFNYPDWLQGQDGHYVTLDDAKAKELNL